MAIKATNENIKRLNWGMHDAVIDGEVVCDLPQKVAYVTDETELDAFAGMPVGSIAIQYGFTAMWQKKADGTWLKFVGAEEET